MGRSRRRRREPDMLAELLRALFGNVTKRIEGFFHGGRLHGAGATNNARAR